MKTIYVVRHAKSSWDISDIPDEKRPLLEKGKKRTRKIIDFLLEKKVRVDYVISSHAVRALDTAKILAHALKYREEDIKVDPNLYFADGDSIFNQFYDLPDRYRYVMIVGHNPALTDFINRFLAKPIDQLPTSGVACIEFDTDQWDLVPVSGHKVNFIISPKELEKKTGNS